MNHQMWINHFERNRENRPEPDWQAPVDVSAEVLKPLVSSLEQFRLSGYAAGTMLWVNHAPCLTAVGGTRGEFYSGITRQVTRFIGSLRKAQKPRGVRPAWAPRQNLLDFSRASR